MVHVDLHSHILPAIDDGAEDIDVSLGILQREAEQGIEHIVFTPHFDPKKDSSQDFFERRNDAYRSLQMTLTDRRAEYGLHFYCGVEIRYSPMLTEMEDLKSFCISGTNVLLIEFPFSHRPEFIKEVFNRLQIDGYLILMAHVERFQWLRDDPDLLYDLVSDGAFAQFNADGMLKDKGVRSFVFKMLKHGLLHGIGSDTHDLSGRPPRIKEASELIRKELGDDMADSLNSFAMELISGTFPESRIPVKPKKNLWDFLKR